jgi:chromosome partitioning protein
MRLALTNLKGGTAKTTSAVYLACVLAKRGSVVLVDADPQGSASLWAEAASDLPFATVAVANTAVARTVLDLTQRWDHVVVDTAPGQIPITTAALQVVDLALVPITTGSVDLVRWGTTADLISSAQGSNTELRAATLLTKTRATTISRRDVRQGLESDGRLPVLQTEVPLRESIAGAEGTTPASLEPYEAVLDELAAVAR